MKDQGIVYVLTNPSMPGMVKIGMTVRSEMDKRLKELYTTGVPLPFECKYACRVKNSECAKIEKALHTAFAPQRVNASREFFRIAPEQAIAILEIFQNGDITEEVTQEIENDLTPEDKAAQEKSKTKRPPIHFLDMGLHEGDVLVYKSDESITCVVLDQKHVQYNGIITTLTPITTDLLGKSYSVQPTRYWKVKESGIDLTELYDKTYPIEETE
jgi:hypothetical protein